MGEPGTLRMRLGCIDIGSNTTRLLVADRGEGGLRPVEERRAFTCIAAALAADGRISPEKIAEVVGVVEDQLACAGALGAASVRIFATAGVRSARNGEELVRRVQEAVALPVAVLAPEEEARLAFLGAAAMMARPLSGMLAVVDLGGGSCELAAGRQPAQVEWSCSLPIGSGTLSARWLRGDPPAEEELRLARAAVEEILDGVEVPRVDEVLAVGGSATSLRRLAGDTLDEAALALALRKICARPALETAGRLGLELQRTRLLPAGLVVLEALSRRFSRALEVGRGGVREGILLEAS